jgi:sugar lactone lactonase YvrE
MKWIFPVGVLLATMAAGQSKDGGVAPAAPAGPKPAMSVAEGLATPESVFYDADSDTYLVSNVDGDPSAKDNNGFIAEVSPDGKMVNPKVVAAGRGGVTLNAPKGMAVRDGILYVADLDTVRMFDRKTGAPKGEVKVPGSTFVNDLSFGPNGLLYVTDSGLTPKFESSGTDGVYVITPGKKPTLKTLVKAKTLNGPNGILATKDSLFVVTFGAAELMTLDLKGESTGPVTKLPKGNLDGVVMVGDELVVSSWEGSALYRGKPGGEFKEIVSKLEGPADIGFDSKRNRVLVPRMKENRVEAWELK